VKLLLPELLGEIKLLLVMMSNLAIGTHKKMKEKSVLQPEIFSQSSENSMDELANDEIDDSFLEEQLLALKTNGLPPLIDFDILLNSVPDTSAIDSTLYSYPANFKKRLLGLIPKIENVKLIPRMDNPTSQKMVNGFEIQRINVLNSLNSMLDTLEELRQFEVCQSNNKRNRDKCLRKTRLRRSAKKTNLNNFADSTKRRLLSQQSVEKVIPKLSDVPNNLVQPEIEIVSEISFSDMISDVIHSSFNLLYRNEDVERYDIPIYYE